MGAIKVECLCHGTEHYISAKNIGKAFVKLRRRPNTPEHMKEISALGVKARKIKKDKEKET